MIFFLVFALDFGTLKLLLSVWILREKLREVNAITLMLRALNSDKSDKKMLILVLRISILYLEVKVCFFSLLIFKEFG